MKKILMALAALSLCTCTFVGCGDDKKDEGPADKAAVGEACEKADDCQSGICGEDKKCAEKPAEGGDAACKDKKENDACGDKKICDKDLKCVDDPNASGEVAADEKCAGKKAGDSCDTDKLCSETLQCDVDISGQVDCSSFVKSCKDAIAYVSCDATNGVVEVDCSKDPDGKTSCYEGECVKPSGSEVECTLNSDCKDPSKPVCGDDHTCVAAQTVDPCAGVTCDAGTCERGLCVTEDMKALKEGDAYTGSIDAFCNGDNLVYKGGDDSKAYVVNCLEDGYTGCVVFEDPTGADHVRTADCNGQQSAVDACAATDKAMIDVCLTPTFASQVYCNTDASGKAIAVPTYREGQLLENCAESGKTCDASGESVVCK